MLLPDDPTRYDDEVVRALAPASRRAAPDRGLGDTLRDLAGDLHGLFRSEVALVRAQIGERISGFAALAAGVAAGALLALVGLIVLILGVAAAVALWLPVWAALLLTGTAVITTGGLVAWLAVTRLAEPTPEPLAAANDDSLVAAAAA